MRKLLRLIDWKRNNKIALRNFSENVDFHDIVKTLLVRMLRRKHKDSCKVPIYTEFNPEEINENYPDIWMKDEHGDIYVWEIQDKISKEWQKSISKHYENISELTIVSLNDLSKNIDELKKQLEKYLI